MPKSHQTSLPYNQDQFLFLQKWSWPLVFFSSDCILISGDEDTSQMYALHKPVPSKSRNSMQSQ